MQTYANREVGWGGGGWGLFQYERSPTNFCKVYSDLEKERKLRLKVEKDQEQYQKTITELKGELRSFINPV